MPDLKDIAVAAGSAMRAMTLIREGIAWFQERGIARDELMARLDALELEDRDFTDVEYAEMAGGAQDAIDRLLGASDDVEAGVPEPVPPTVDDGSNVTNIDDNPIENEVGGGTPGNAA